MTPENPLLLPRTVWQIALVVTLILVAIRAGLYVRDRKRAVIGAGHGVSRMRNRVSERLLFNRSVLFSCAMTWAGWQPQGYDSRKERKKMRRINRFKAVAFALWLVVPGMTCASDVFSSDAFKEITRAYEDSQSNWENLEFEFRMVVDFFEGEENPTGAFNYDGRCTLGKRGETRIEMDRVPSGIPGEVAQYATAVINDDMFAYTSDVLGSHTEYERGGSGEFQVEYRQDKSSFLTPIRDYFADFVIGFESAERFVETFRGSELEIAVLAAPTPGYILALPSHRGEHNYYEVTMLESDNYRPSSTIMRNADGDVVAELLAEYSHVSPFGMLPKRVTQYRSAGDGVLMEVISADFGSYRRRDDIDDQFFMSSSLPLYDGQQMRQVFRLDGTIESYFRGRRGWVRAEGSVDEGFYLPPESESFSPISMISNISLKTMLIFGGVAFIVLGLLLQLRSTKARMAEGKFS